MATSCVSCAALLYQAVILTLTAPLQQVFHHLNAKMVLLSDNFVILDECFFRAPGLNVMRDVPKAYLIPADTPVSFDKYLATLDEAVFEEEKVGPDFVDTIVSLLLTSAFRT